MARRRKKKGKKKHYSLGKRINAFNLIWDPNRASQSFKDED